MNKQIPNTGTCSKLILGLPAIVQAAQLLRYLGLPRKILDINPYGVDVFVVVDGPCSRARASTGGRRSFSSGRHLVGVILSAFGSLLLCWLLPYNGDEQAPNTNLMALSMPAGMIPKW